MTRVTLTRPWLAFDLGAEMQVLSWTLNRPGFTRARRLLWREVRNADLPVDLDVDRWLAEVLVAQGASDAPTFLTSRNISAYIEAEVTVGGATAHAVATVGLSNAERIGQRMDRSGQDWGTINVGLRLDTALTQAALLEVMSLTVAARTAAVMDAGVDLPTGRATGTGTDCVAVAAPEGPGRYAGMHTEIGEAAGRAVYDTVRRGAEAWIATQGKDEGPWT